MLRTLLVGAVVGTLLAVGGVAAAMSALSTTAKDVATEMQNENGGVDPLAPPEFYGGR